ncbi:MAG: DUF1289 domain-containing protein [Sphingopyxis sp.]|nr:DUF1289 domain-containing protein [Sphingopyxis sp.]
MQDSKTLPDSPAVMDGQAPASPCIGVCRLDSAQFFVGCGRHIVEIAAAGVAAEQARARRLQES